MDAIVIAGGLPEEKDPLYRYTQGKHKSLLDIAGKPMIQWVLDALSGADSVDKIVVVGLDKTKKFKCTKRLAFIPDKGGIIQNICEGANYLGQENPIGEYILIVSSDIPSITPEIVDWVIMAALETEHDFYYNIISREVMEQRFPNSNRSYARFKDIEVCGGDMNVVRRNMVNGENRLWQRIVDTRKNVFKQAALIGFDTLFLLVFRLITLDEAVRKVTQRLNLSGRAILCPYAEVGMDVDKPHQLEIMRADLSRRRI